MCTDSCKSTFLWLWFHLDAFIKGCTSLGTRPYCNKGLVHCTVTVFPEYYEKSYQFGNKTSCTWNTFFTGMLTLVQFAVTLQLIAIWRLSLTQLRNCSTVFPWPPSNQTFVCNRTTAITTWGGSKKYNSQLHQPINSNQWRTMQLWCFNNFTHKAETPKAKPF